MIVQHLPVLRQPNLRATAQRKLLGLLEKIALANEACPAASEIRDMTGIATPSDPILQLRRAGLITIEWSSCKKRRRIYVATVAKWTDWSRKPAANSSTNPRVTKDPDGYMAKRMKGRQYEDLPGFDRIGRTGKIIITHAGYFA